MSINYKEQNIRLLDISCSTIEILKENKLTSIGQLCKKNRTDLKKIGLTNNEINKIDIELQLRGVNLKGAL